MKTIEKYFNKINLNQNLLFEKMGGYRKKIADLILPNFTNLPDKQSLLVIGAGVLNDIPLKDIVPYFDSITLTDISLISMEQGIKNHHINEQEMKKIHLEKVEYTGCESTQLFETLTLQLKERVPYQTMIQQFTEAIQQSLTYEFLPHQTYSCIMISPIYTQLIYHEAIEIFTPYKRIEQNAFQREVLNQIPGVIDHFNETVKKRLAPNGKLIVLSDIFEAKKHSRFLNEMEPILENNDKMEAFYSRYVTKYGPGLGDYGLLSISEGKNVLQKQWLSWTLQNERTFIVKMVIIGNN